MTRHIPDGDTLRPLEGAIIDISNGWSDDLPANPHPHLSAIEADREFADWHAVMSRSLIRPQPRQPWPWWAWMIFGAAVMLGAMGLALIAADMIATGAATAAQSREYVAW